MAFGGTQCVPTLSASLLLAGVVLTASNLRLLEILTGVILWEGLELERRILHGKASVELLLDHGGVRPQKSQRNIRGGPTKK
jgi:hypothetical protein